MPNLQIRWRLSLLGYRPSAVSAALDSLERFYLSAQQRFAAHRDTVANAISLLQPTVEALESLVKAAHAAGQPTPHEEAPPTRALVLPAPFRYGPLPRALFGYRFDVVEDAFRRVQTEWEAELGVLMAEVEAMEKQRSILTKRMMVAERQLREMRFSVNAARLATARPPENLVPMRREERLAVRPAPAPAANQRKPAEVWRPGMVEISGAAEMVAASHMAHLTDGTRRPLAPVAVSQVMASLPIAAAMQPPEAEAQVGSNPDIRPPVPEVTIRSATAAEGAEAQLQAGLQNRLELLFQRFLAGKVLGGDLSAPDGEVLATRGAPITRELVARAEQAGVLPSLIAHMTVPGLSGE